MVEQAVNFNPFSVAARALRETEARCEHTIAIGPPYDVEQLQRELADAQAALALLDPLTAAELKVQHKPETELEFEQVNLTVNLGEYFAEAYAVKPYADQPWSYDGGLTLASAVAGLLAILERDRRNAEVALG